MAENKFVFENYGLNPPENSKPFWEDNNAFSEDKTISKMDLQVSLQKLSPTEKEIIQLFNEGYSVRDMVEMINLPRATIQDIKTNAISKLREMMNGKDSIHGVFATDTECDTA